MPCYLGLSIMGNWQQRTRLRPLILGLLVVAGAAVDGRDILYESGHNDLAVDYDPETGWKAYIHDYADNSQREATTTIYSVGETARVQVPDDPAYSLLGAPGDTIWVVPEIFDPEILYLGIGAPLLGRNIFTGGLSNRGQVTMRLLSVTGTGPDAGGTLTMWQSGFPPRFHFSSADGIGPEDALNAITANFHAHYNWGFTKPGLYRVAFEYSGTLVPELGGAATSTQVTYTFQIMEAGSDSPLRYAWPVGDGWSWSSWMGYVYLEHDPWVWSFRNGWSYFPPSPPENLRFWSVRHGWLWTTQHLYPWLWDEEAETWFVE